MVRDITKKVQFSIRQLLKTNDCMNKVICILVILIMIFTVRHAYANGAVWNPGTITGTPGPVKQSALILEEERVDIENGTNHIERIVTAWFKVRNPTKKPITVIMGFPIDYSNVQKKGDEGYLGSFVGKVNVKVDGEQKSPVVKHDLGKNYSAVILWNMTFPPGRSTEFEVTYPARMDEDARDEPDYETGGGGSTSIRVFRYITHTGAFWAGPIGKATINYCDKYISPDLYNEEHHASFEWSEDGQEERSVVWDFDMKPKPYHVDIEKRCIVWNREQWVPKKPDDDIEIKVYERNYTTIYKTRDSMPPSDELKIGRVDYLRLWCGIDAHGRKGQQVADIYGVADKRIGIELYLDIEKKAYYYPVNPPVYRNANEQPSDSTSLDAMPTHLKSDFELILLRYLRNYLYAIHGHQFKSADLAECFQGIKSRRMWTDVEKWNVEWLVDYEKQIKELNTWSWEKIKNNSQK